MATAVMYRNMKNTSNLGGALRSKVTNGGRDDLYRFLRACGLNDKITHEDQVTCTVTMNQKTHLIFPKEYVPDVLSLKIHHLYLLKQMKQRAYSLQPGYDMFFQRYPYEYLPWLNLKVCDPNIPAVEQVPSIERVGIDIVMQSLREEYKAYIP